MEKHVKINRRRLFIGFFILFLLSGAGTFLYLKNISNTHYVYLYFTNYKGKHLLSEKRKFLKSKNRIDNIKNVLTELTHGPLSNYLEPIFNHTAYIKNVWLAGSFLYVNLNETFVKKNKTSDLSIKSFNYTVFKNFPYVKRIKYLINGNNYHTISGFENLGVIYFRPSEIE